MDTSKPMSRATFVLFAREALHRIGIDKDTCSKLTAKSFRRGAASHGVLQQLSTADISHCSRTSSTDWIAYYDQKSLPDRLELQYKMGVWLRQRWPTILTTSSRVVTIGEVDHWVFGIYDPALTNLLQLLLVLECICWFLRPAAAYHYRALVPSASICVSSTWTSRTSHTESGLFWNYRTS